MQSSVLCSVRVNMMERRPLVAIGWKATDRIRDIGCQTCVPRVLCFPSSRAHIWFVPVLVLVY